MRNKTLPKLARKYPPYKNRILLVTEVNLCSEWARSHVLWIVLSLNQSALSFCCELSVCSVQFIVHNHQEPGYLCLPATLGLNPQLSICLIVSHLIFPPRYLEGEP